MSDTVTCYINNLPEDFQFRPVTVNIENLNYAKSDYLNLRIGVFKISARISKIGRNLVYDETADCYVQLEKYVVASCDDCSRIIARDEEDYLQEQL